MTTRNEVDRLTAVYRGYEEDAGRAAVYDLANRGNRLILQERWAKIATLLNRHGYWPLDRLRILDVGCGGGADLARLNQMGAKPDLLHGVDLMPPRVLAAKARTPDITFQIGNAEDLPYADNTFDLVLVFAVFSSILEDRMARRVAAEITRVLRPGGAVIWYDLRYPSPANRNVRAMSRATVHRLFPTLAPSLTSVTVLPPLARRLGRWSSRLYPRLAKVWFLRSHHLGLLRKPAA